MDANASAYLETWTEELRSRASRVRQLIGSAHWLSDGHHKEELVRDFIRRYLPIDLVVARGFVKTTGDFSRCSPEIDILVSDPCRNTPLFMEGGLQIVDASSVLALVEVKTAFSKPKLVEALTSARRSLELATTGRSATSVFSLVHFFTGEVDGDSTLRTLESAAREVVQSLRPPVEQRNLLWPQVVSVMNVGVIFISSAEDEVRIRQFDSGDLSLACALSDMFGHIRQIRGGTPMGGFDDIIESTPFPAPRLLTLDLR
jgi:hypothetical protein